LIIANPLYDTAFKGLIKDPDVAKALIGTLLGVKVLDVQSNVTEYNKPMTKDDKFPKYLRLDYCAVIKNKDGKEHKILIEIQKASGADDILRFREYLAVAGYMPDKETKEKEKSPLPIVTIYFLGFELKNVMTPCLKVARQYVDMLENKVLETREKFVELLTHDSFIIQAPRIKTDENPKTELEKILSVFEQNHFADNKETTINYPYPINDNYVKKMVDILHYIGTDPEERKKMDNEAYWQRYEDCTSGRLLRMQEELDEKDRKLREVAKELKSDGMPVEKISKMTNLPVEEIEEL
jgi:predicted transposase/invertase (TIGR01784 family)